MRKSVHDRRVFAGALLAAGALVASSTLSSPAVAHEEYDDPSLAVAVHGAAAEHDGPGRPAGRILTAEETDCYESAVNRAANYAELRRRVPARYELVKLAGVEAGRISFVNVRCIVSIDGHPTRLTTASYVIAAVVSRDGQPSTSPYLLAHGVNNPEMAARYRAAGLPTQWQPDTTAFETVNDVGVEGVTWKVVGDGMDHTLVASSRYSPPPGTPVELSTVRFYHDGPRGDLVLTFSNRLQSLPGGAPVVADFTTATELVPLFFTPAQLKVNGSRFAFIRGGWTTELSKLG